MNKNKEHPDIRRMSQLAAIAFVAAEAAEALAGRWLSDEPTEADLLALDAEALFEAACDRAAHGDLPNAAKLLRQATSVYDLVLA